MSEWVAVYNKSGVKNEVNPDVFNMVNDLPPSVIVCSHLRRSIHSAQLIGLPTLHLADELFREAELPDIHIPIIKLNPETWSMLFRMFWFVGFSKQAEPLPVFKQRAIVAAEKLIELAINHDTVLFIGHGIINRFLAKELIAREWLGTEAPNDNKYWGYKYWEYATYTKNRFTSVSS